jgi:hypothetical protein
LKLGEHWSTNINGNDQNPISHTILSTISWIILASAFLVQGFSDHGSQIKNVRKPEGSPSDLGIWQWQRDLKVRALLLHLGFECRMPNGAGLQDKSGRFLLQNRVWMHVLILVTSPEWRIQFDFSISR